MCIPKYISTTDLSLYNATCMHVSRVDHLISTEEYWKDWKSQRNRVFAMKLCLQGMLEAKPISLTIMSA